MTITVVNLKKQSSDFICDRSNVLGNPFVLFPYTTRDEVCDKYEQYFYQNLNPDVAPVGFLEEVDKIYQTAKEKDITLGCWCSPKRCHCDTIKHYIESLL